MSLPPRAGRVVYGVAVYNGGMTEHKTFPGKTYVVTSKAGCDITDASGELEETCEPGKQKVINAPSDILYTSAPAVVRETFNLAPALGSGSGGGVEIKFDTTPTQNSTNAVTSGGLYDLLNGEPFVLGKGSQATAADSIAFGIGAQATGQMASLAIGKGAKATGYLNVALGVNASATNNCTAVGNTARAEYYGSVAIGSGSLANKFFGVALGATAQVKDDGTICLGTASSNNNQTGIITRLYIVGAGTPLANQYYGDENGQNGAAFMGYVTRDWNGNVFACGTKKLSDLFNENTAFAPAALDLDADTPTPFLPTGSMDPIELPEDLTE